MLKSNVIIIYKKPQRKKEMRIALNLLNIQHPNKNGHNFRQDLKEIIKNYNSIKRKVNLNPNL